ncbi:MAG: FAD-dependent oxidoreductase [Nodosilinea sp.]
MGFVDYDVVIVGGSLQARAAAARGARQGARMALAEPPGEVERELAGQLLVRHLVQLHSSAAKPLDWAACGRYIQRTVEVAYPQWTRSALVAQGVDVLEERGQLSPGPPLTLITPQRQLRSRGVILAPAGQSPLPPMPGLAERAYLSLADLAALPQRPDRLVILGRRPLAIALAQALAHLGTLVTLVSRGDRLLPEEDTDISDFVESLVIAAGVDLRLGTSVSEITGEAPLTLHLPDQPPLVTDHLLVASLPRPHLAPLNLSALGISTETAYLSVDDHLSTVHPRIFACGPALGGYWAEVRDHQDVAIVLDNALYLPRRTVRWHHRQALLPTWPPLGRLGMTAAQAKAWYGPAVTVLQAPLSGVVSSHLSDHTTGFCRWVVDQEGQLLGAQVIGPEADQILATLAMTLQHRLGLPDLAQIPRLPYSSSEILNQLLETWQQQRWQPGRWRRDWAENWFNWRRTRQDGGT